MERHNVVIASLVFVGLLLIGAGPVLGQGAPSEEEMIKERLQSDLENLREENESLREELEEVRRQNEQRTEEASTDGQTSRVEALKAENRRLRKILSQYRDIFNELVKEVKQADTTFQTTVAPAREVTETPTTEEEADSESKWMNDPDRPYPIRRQPLEEEITYVTDPDDTLSKIAHQFYHDAELWIRIYLVNENRLESPDTLPPGTELRLPPIDRIQQE